MIPHTCSDPVHAAPGRSSPWPMLDVPTALRTVLQHVAPLPPVAAPLHPLALLGHVLAAPITAPHPFPPFRASVMDGYACQAVDTPGTLAVRTSVRAGDSDSDSAELTSGQCAYITTGAPVPSGADTVVMIEHTEPVTDQPTHVRVLPSLTPGTNIRPIGCDVRQGELLASAGTVIGASEVGLLASFGLTSVTVHRAPRVGVLSTGDELIDYHQSVASISHIRDSNRPMLLSMLKHLANIDAIDLGIARDSDSDLIERISKAHSECDIVITSGGVSMGDRDRIKPIIERLGTIHFGRVAMKPGKPLTFATIPINSDSDSDRALLFFGLPGNPVSAFVTFLLFVLPAIRIMRGEVIDTDNHSLARVQAKVVGDWQRDKERREYHRCLLTFDSKSKSLIALSTGGQLSSRLTSTAHANALAIIDPGTDRVSDGSVIDALLFDSVKSFSKEELSEKIKQARHTQSTNSHHHHHAHSHTHSNTHTGTNSTTQLATASTAPTATACPHHAGTAIPSAPTALRACVLTVSDRCSRGEADDRSGATLAALLERNDYGCTTTVTARACVPDEITHIQRALLAWTDTTDPPSLIVTTGGTGLSQRDRTPEAVEPLLERRVPGLVHLMLSTSLTLSPLGPLTCLSRPVAGTRGRTLIVTMPGSESACKEMWSALKPVMQHAIQILSGQ